ncbi:LysR family transcriptional regulator [Actinoplanes awajinensis]|uniref:LysR family transcriptional regulator n=1 Tax=Actinoplanes awajinensis TaxID=135946 RepID=UPI000A8D6DC7|nr:LysR family transcriptional regulator [Actinoplanes awajinensis]
MDLNLLKGLDALLEHRSVQDAAAQLGLTQPAVSRILARLRTATGDAILVRAGREMVPTGRALELRDEVRDLVARAESVLAPRRRPRSCDVVARVHRPLPRRVPVGGRADPRTDGG